MSFYVLRLYMWRMCVHGLLIYVHLERSDANLLCLEFEFEEIHV